MAVRRSLVVTCPKCGGMHRVTVDENGEVWIMSGEATEELVE